MDLVATSRTRTTALDRWFGTRAALAGWSIALLVCNCVLVVTGAVVRLTASGLGCDTWPHCNANSYVGHGEFGYHTYIEFGNRLLTFVLIAIAVATLVAAVRCRATRREKMWCWAILLGLPMQGVVGGIVVLSHLNPWLVALHLLLSIALIVWNVDLVQLATGRSRAPLPRSERVLTGVLFWLTMFAIWMGTVVTGAGPHSGSDGTHRNNLPILWVARAHAEVVWVVVLLTLALLWRTTRLQAMRARRWALLLLAALLVQGAIGYAQYFAGLPVWLVSLHMAGLTLVTTAVSWLWYGTREQVA